MRLSVFRGGFTRELAEQVTDAKLDVLSALIMKSLIRRIAEKRYDMHEVVRQYGLIQLDLANLVEQTRNAHLEAFARLVETAELRLQEGWLNRLDLERDNLRAALEWSKYLPNGEETGLRLAANLWLYWDVRGDFTEGRQWLKETLAKAPHRTSTRAKALKAAGALAWAQGDFISARELLSESLTIYQESGNKRDIAAGLLNLGILSNSQGDYASAGPLFQQSLGIFRELEHKQGIANVLNSLGVWASDQGDYASERSYIEESLALRQEIGDKRGVAVGLGNLGVAALRQGDSATARTLLQESLERYRELGDKRGAGTTLNELGQVALQIGELDMAHSLFIESLAIWQELGSKEGLLAFLEGSARLACSSGDHERAARLLSAARGLREQVGLPLPSVNRNDQDCLLSSMQEVLGKDRFSALCAEGKEMTLESAIAYALSKK